MKKILIILIFLIAFLTLGYIFVTGWYADETTKPNSSDNSIVNFEVKLGDTPDVVSKKLLDNNLITSSELFLLFVKQTSQSSKIKAGTFQIAKNLNFQQILDVLNNPKSTNVKIFFPEGLRADEIATTLADEFSSYDKVSFDKKTFIDIVNNPSKYSLDSNIAKTYIPKGKTLEGFLFPDTYMVEPNITTQALVEKLLNSFETRFLDLYKNSSKKYSLYETVTLASIIEREGRGATERANISDVLGKRLDGKGDGTKLLGADATLLYEQKNWKFVITNDTKAKNTPYNSYLKPGLPPTPISNPGLESLKASINPTSNPYFYYLHGTDGVIHYAVTYADHNKNIRCYINGNTSFCN
ncbi:MAG: endolytic transglycosylase MltG [bacterium]